MKFEPIIVIRSSNTLDAANFRDNVWVVSQHHMKFLNWIGNEMRLAKSIPLSLGILSAFFSLDVRAEDGEMLIGPISYQQDVNSVIVDLTASTYFRLETTDSQVQLSARVVANLVDLQRKIGAIVETFPLPVNNCGSFSGNNPVVSIPRKELVSSGDQAVFSIGGTVTMWDCRENPIPNSKVEWRVENVGFGIKTKVPKVITWPGDPIKNTLGSQSFDVDIPLTLTNTDQSVSLVLGKPNVELKGQYAFITNGVLKIADIDINEKVHAALLKAIEPDKLRVSIPAELLEFNPSITGARFVSNGQELNVELNLHAAVPAATLTNVVTKLLPEQPGVAQTPNQ